MFGPHSQKVSRGGNIFIRSTENSGERGNPFFTIGVNAKSVTNFRCWVAEWSKALGENLEEGGGPGSNPAAGSWSLFTLAV